MNTLEKACHYHCKVPLLALYEHLVEIVQYTLLDLDLETCAVSASTQLIDASAFTDWNIDTVSLKGQPLAQSVKCTRYCMLRKTRCRPDAVTAPAINQTKYKHTVPSAFHRLR
jgi:hypothetical protein